MGVEPINKVGVDCQIADEFKPLLEVPLQVVGKRAEKHVTSDSIIRLVVDGPYFELHGLETAEILTRSGTALPHGRNPGDRAQVSSPTTRPTGRDTKELTW
jgi:hypothetical protein